MITTNNLAMVYDLICMYVLVQVKMVDYYFINIRETLFAAAFIRFRVHLDLRQVPHLTVPVLVCCAWKDVTAKLLVR